jgi:hypothetical protein
VLHEDVRDLADGSVWAEVIIGLPLAGTGGVTEVLRTWHPPPAGAGRYGANPAFVTEDRYTGLIVDASGLGFVPALAPRLLTADAGGQVFGIADVDPLALERRGVVAYRDSLSAARIDPRVGAHPLVVRALGVSGQRQGDLLVSGRDAERIRSLDRQARVLSDAAVIVVVGEARPNAERTGRAHALVVGVADFQPPVTGAGPPALRYPAEDARAMGHLLTQRAGVTPADLTVLINAQARRDAVYAALRDLRARVHEDDVVLIYFSGHGSTGLGPGASPHYYLLPYDVRLDSLDRTAIRDDAFEELIAQLPARQVVVWLDACHSGGVGGHRAKGLGSHVPAMPASRLFVEASVGRVVISASPPDQPALEDEGLRHGVFTHFLLEGASGPADRNGDGQVTVLEMYEHVSRAVRSYTLATHGFEQVPVLDVRGMTGEIVLSRGPRGGSLGR